MFNIVLQQMNSPKNKIGKNIVNVMTISGNLRNDCSIKTPVILVESDASVLSDCNYMYIAVFGRYYFITDIVTLSGGLVEIHGKVDVLETYKAEILANTAIVKRQANRWNLYLNDGSLKTYANPGIITKAFPSGFGTYEFVLAVAGS